MTAEFGLFCLIVAFACALLQATYLLRSNIAACLPGAAWLQAFCVALALGSLAVARIDCDFTVVNVAEHSNLTLPLLYKIVGSWGNHEGSMLLFALVLSVFGALLATKHDLAAAIQAALGAGLLLFILLTSNPFARQFPPLPDGQALNPLLQDIALVMHPPLLYLGYVGFGAVFSLAVAALMMRRLDASWAKAAHPWILASWSALTVGIGLGSWWAYRVLGWGGFWFWDPVENASLLPWLAGTALLHANVVLKKRGMLAPWVALLSIVTFGLSLLGTFLVRSGVLVSVHSFAHDPARGLFILAYLIVVLGSGLLLFALRAGELRTEKPMLPFSREGLIVANNLFVLTACVTVLLGTLYPMFAETFGERVSVGPPYYNATFLPLMILPLILAGLAPFVPWQQGNRALLQRCAPAALAALAAAFLVLALAKQEVALAALGLTMAAWLAVSSLQWLRLRASLPAGLAHLGFAIVITGVTGAGLWKHSSEHWMAQGDAIDMAGYHVAYVKDEPADAPNYHGKRVYLRVTHVEREITTLVPEYRRYDIVGTSTSEAALYHALSGDLYAVVGESSADGKRVAVRLYYNPMIGLIWLGCVLMALGGILSIRRILHGAPEL